MATRLNFSFRLLFRILLLLVIISSFALIFTTASFNAHAAYSLPSWWNNATCDNTKGHNSGAKLIGTWEGLQSCAGGNLYKSTFGGQWPKGIGEWQCVELVFRYLYFAFGQTVYSANGKDIVNNYPANPGIQLQKVPNNSTQKQGPQTGDVLSFGPYGKNLAGHTAIVTKGVPSGGTGYITIFMEWF
ncbi:MAG: CHAP domain-containing protein [Ktedonobacteraceae bacterium]